MKTFTRIIVFFIATLASARGLLATDLAIGTWTSKNYPGMTMIIEPRVAGGWKITYHIKYGDKESLMVIDSALDGAEVPVMVNGKASGETMAIKKLDYHHTSTVVKMNGAPFGTSNSELSADGKTITVQNDTVALAGNPSKKATETWDRK